MTYRNKLLLKRALKILCIVLAAVFVVLLVGFTYLGRYVVYTEDGAYFSFHAQTASSSPSAAAITAANNINLTIGSSISTTDTLGSNNSINDTDVNGIFVDYATLQDGSTLNSLELTSDSCNTLVLEMRSAGSDLLNTDEVLALIERAKSQEVRLIAQISCLDDSTYAKAHPTEALHSSTDTLWTDSDGENWLDPSQDSVIAYLSGLVQQLSALGFDEVILDNFSFPTDEDITFDAGDSTRGDILAKAYNNLVDSTVDFCDIGLLIKDPNEGHQAIEAADRIYVYYDDGATVKTYADLHPDQYLVFITDSHDTRFDDYGRIYTSDKLDVSPITTSDTGTGTDETQTDDTENTDTEENG